MEVNNTVANGEVDSPQEMEINYTGSSSSEDFENKFPHDNKEEDLEV